MNRNKKGELTMNTKERVEIWKEYFDKLLNTEEPKELINPFQPKLILVHITITGTCRRAYKTCENWPLCSYGG